MSKRRLINILLGTGRFLLLSLFLIGVLAPIYWILVTSFKTDAEIVNVNNITYWPDQFTLDNYESLFNQLDFGIYLRNSILLSLSSAAIVLIYSILGGYALARYKFKSKKMVIGFFLLSQMIPSVLLTIPIYIIYANIGLINSKLGLLILYVIINSPFCLITMRSFFERIPVSLEDAARVDGCNKIQSLWRIIIPVLFPGIVAVFVFAFIGAWNDLLMGVIFTLSASNWTIPVGMKALIGKYNVHWGELMAGGVIALVPTIIMFAFVQRYIVEGLTAGAVKE
ncbi:MAG TPA: carbohydrate ABC transporter permease [Clostridiales bacterium]|nr:carbohydrate ABC transporter permease [Clostridiales bacterium]